MTLFRILRPATLLLLAAAPLNAQETRADSLARFLERVLLSVPFGAGSSPEIVLGRLSPPLDSLTMPAGVSILGTVAYPFHRIAVLESATPSEAVAALVEQFTSAGWTMPEPQLWRELTPGPVGESRSLCRDQSSVTIGLPRDERGRGSVMLLYTDVPSLSPCREPVAADSVITRLRTQSPLGRLDPPRGTVQLSGGGGGSSDDWRFVALPHTMMPHEAVHAHYGAQLERNGAIFGASLTGEDVMVRRFRINDGQGATWAGTLVTTRGGSDRHVRVWIDVMREVSEPTRGE